MIDEAPSIVRSRKVRTALIGAAVLALVATATAVGLALRPDSFTVRGTITVSDPDSNGLAFVGNTSVCQGKGGYSDLRAGAQVVVTDASGTTVAAGQIDGPGKATTTGVTARPVKCEFAFTVADVPGGHDFYGVEVAGRGKVQYKVEEVQQPLRLTIG